MDSASSTPQFPVECITEAHLTGKNDLFFLVNWKEPCVDGKPLSWEPYNNVKDLSCLDDFLQTDYWKKYISSPVLKAFAKAHPDRVPQLENTGPIRVPRKKQLLIKYANEMATLPVDLPMIPAPPTTSALHTIHELPAVPFPQPTESMEVIPNSQSSSSRDEYDFQVNTPPSKRLVSMIPKSTRFVSKKLIKPRAEKRKRTSPTTSPQTMLNYYSSPSAVDNAEESGKNKATKKPKLPHSRLTSRSDRFACDVFDKHGIMRKCEEEFDSEGHINIAYYFYLRDNPQKFFNYGDAHKQVLKKNKDATKKENIDIVESYCAKHNIAFNNKRVYTAFAHAISMYEEELRNTKAEYDAKIELITNDADTRIELLTKDNDTRIELLTKENDAKIEQLVQDYERQKKAQTANHSITCKALTEAHGAASKRWDMQNSIQQKQIDQLKDQNAQFRDDLNSHHKEIGKQIGEIAFYKARLGIA
jgi:hypothetical protein